jgi:hypothetical protein
VIASMLLLMAEAYRSRPAGPSEFFAGAAPRHFRCFLRSPLAALLCAFAPWREPCREVFDAPETLARGWRQWYRAAR